MYKLSLLVLLFLIAINYTSAFTQKDSASTEPQVIKAVASYYPALAMTAHISGKVIVDVEIDAAGNVTTTKIVEGHPLLTKVTEESARKWQFQPTTATEKARHTKLTFTYKIMPLQTKDADLTPIFIAPYEFEIRRCELQIETLKLH